MEVNREILNHNKNNHGKRLIYYRKSNYNMGNRFISIEKKMTEQHKEFQALLQEMGLNYRSLADLLGMQYKSVKNQCRPGVPLPRWAVAMLITKNHYEI